MKNNVNIKKVSFAIIAFSLFCLLSLIAAAVSALGLIVTFGQEEDAIKNISVRLSEDISVQVYTAPPAAAENMSMSFTQTDASQTSRETVVTEYVREGEQLMFTYEGMAANHIGDTLDIKFTYTVNGEETVCRRETSVQAYLTTLLKNTAQENNVNGLVDAKTKILAVSLLNYAAEAQIYTEYDVDNLVNEGITGSGIVFDGIKSDNVYVKPTGEYDTAVFRGANLNFSNNVALMFAFDVKEEYQVQEGLKLVVSKGGQEYTSTEVVSGGEVADYIAYFREVSVTEFDEKLTVRVCDGDTVISNDLNYSVASYVDNMKNDTKMGALAKAVYAYGLGAIDLKQSQSHRHDYSLEVLLADDAVYLQGETFNTENITATLVCSCGYDTVTLSNEQISVSVDDSLAAGSNAVSLSCTHGAQNYQKTVSVNALAYQSLALETAPTRTVYKNGASFDATGMVLNAVYENDYTKEITEGYTVDKTTFTPQDTSVILTYNNKSVTIPITVREGYSVSLTPQDPATTTEKYYVETASQISGNNEFAAAKNPTRISAIKIGATLSFHIYAEQAGEVAVYMKGGSQRSDGVRYTYTGNSNGYVFSTLDLKIEYCMSIQVKNGDADYQDVPVNKDATFKGLDMSSADPAAAYKNNHALTSNYSEELIAQSVYLEEGDNIIEITVLNVQNMAMEAEGLTSAEAKAAYRSAWDTSSPTFNVYGFRVSYIV